MFCSCDSPPELRAAKKHTTWSLLEIYPTQKLQVSLPSMLASCTTTSSLLVFSSSTPDGRSGATQPRQRRAVKLSQCGYTSETDLIIGAKDPITDSKAYLSQTRVFLKVFLIWLYIQVPQSMLLEKCVHSVLLFEQEGQVSTLFAWITGGGWRQIRARLRCHSGREDGSMVGKCLSTFQVAELTPGQP